MTYALGIDIGTSFTAAAVSRRDPKSDTVTATPLLLGNHAPTVPSVVFLSDDGAVHVGEAAERRAIGHPDRIIREFKRRIGDSVPIVVGEIAVPAEDVYALVARWVVDRAEEREGTHPTSIIITHPAAWGGYKTDLVRAALAGVGLSDVSLVTEPHAAAVHYASRERVANGSVIAVYDLGGGTFDTAILRKIDTGVFTMLGRPDGLERLGGADFDDIVFQHVTAELAEPISKLDLTDPAALFALARLRRECVDAKEALSYDGDVSVPVQLPGYHCRVRLVRSEFEDLIGGLVRSSIAAMKNALETAKLDAEDLTSVVLIGGSSRIPLITELLSQELRRPIAVDVDPKASISLGAAAVASARLIAASNSLVEPAIAGEESSEASGAFGMPKPVAESESSSARRPTLVPRPKVATVVPLMSRASVRIITIAAAGATILVLAGTASGISSNSTLAAEAAPADYTQWRTADNNSTSIFANPELTPAPQSTDEGASTGSDEVTSDNSITPPRRGSTEKEKGGTTTDNNAFSPGAPAGGGTPANDSAPASTDSTPAGEPPAPSMDASTVPTPTPTTQPETTPEPVPTPVPTSDPQPEPESVSEPQPSEQMLSTATVAPEPGPTIPSEEPTSTAV